MVYIFRIVSTFMENVSTILDREKGNERLPMVTTKPIRIALRKMINFSLSVQKKQPPLRRLLYIYIYNNSVLHKRWSVVGSQQQQRSPIFVDWAICRRFNYNKRPAISLPLYSLRTHPSAITRQGLNNQTLKLYLNFQRGGT